MDTRVKPAYDEFEETRLSAPMLIRPINIKVRSGAGFLIDTTVIASEAKQSSVAKDWIASSLRSSQ
jgi:hypothetical protein